MKKTVLTTLGFVMTLAIVLNHNASTQHALKLKERKQYTHGNHF